MAEKQSIQSGRQAGRQKTRVPFFGSYSNRSDSPNKDQRFLNVIPESKKVQQLDNTRITTIKRPGLKFYKNVNASGGEGRGFTHFIDSFVAIVGPDVWRVSPSATTKLFSFNTSTGPCGIVWCDSVEKGQYLFLCDGTAGWIVDDTWTATKIANDGISKISLTNGGLHYVTTPTVTISGGGGTGATATATISNGSVTQLTITNAGTGYTTDPVVTITPIGSGATGTATITTGGVSSITVTAGGSGYTVAPDVIISGGGGSGAVGKAVLTGDTVTSVTMTSFGTGYTVAPTVTFSSGDGATGLAFRNGFPETHKPSPTFIDGYVLLAGAGDLSGLIFNSTNDDPFDWPANEYIAAEMFPDTVHTLARQNNQVLAFGDVSTEFFYDAANVNESPLSRNDAAALQIGIAAPHLIYQNEKYCAFVGQSDSGGRAVWVLEGFQAKKISDEFIEKILDAEGDMTNTHGYGLRTLGHMLFLINLKNQNRTLVYDFDEKIWHEWSSSIGSGIYNEFRCDHVADAGTGMAFMLDVANGNIYKLDPNYYQDDYQFTTTTELEPEPVISSTPIRCMIRTNKFDMDTYNRKFMSGIKIVGDRYASNNLVLVSWSDDDYQTWSNTKVVTLTDDFPSFARLGAFRRRAFRIDHDFNQPLRLESIELIYDEGTS